ncbi:MAG: molecular chaperone DnaJ [Bdellovibrionota bacterium]
MSRSQQRELRDFYEVLGVDRKSDQDTIKKAYRKLAMQFHPDKNPGDKEAEEKFKEAATAYEVLGNTEKRGKYDRFGHAAFSQGAGRQGFQDVDDIFASFSDIFGDFFGGGMGARGGRGRRNSTAPARGSDLRYICEVKLKDVIKGIERDVEFETDEACKECTGTGAAKGSESDVCNTCGGNGQVIAQQGFFTVQTTCPKCQGAGRIIKNPCTSCQGRGRQRVSRKIRVNVPAGVDNGTQLRVSNEGEGGYRGGPPGDLYVEIRVEEHDVFQRHGLDLLAPLKVSYIQALLGAEIETETLDGEEKITIPAGSNSGDRLRIEKRGVPSIRGGGRGSLYLEIDVEVPKKLTKDEEKLLREIAELRKETVLPPKKGLFSR